MNKENFQKFQEYIEQCRSEGKTPVLDETTMYKETIVYSMQKSAGAISNSNSKLTGEL